MICMYLQWWCNLFVLYMSFLFLEFQSLLMVDDSMPPDCGLSNKQASGVKGKKLWLTYLFITNADRSRELSLLIIGKAWKPHAIKNKTGPCLVSTTQAMQRPGWHLPSTKSGCLTGTRNSRTRITRSYSCKTIFQATLSQSLLQTFVLWISNQTLLHTFNPTTKGLFAASRPITMQSSFIVPLINMKPASLLLRFTTLINSKQCTLLMKLGMKSTQ